MNVFLINPPYYFMGELEYLTQNLGLGYIASCLLSDGHHVEVLDALAEGKENVKRVTVDGRPVSRIGLEFDDIADRIPQGTDLIGITAPFSNHAVIIDDLSRAIRKRFRDAPIVLGGVYASTQPERALESAVDFIVVGEGESPMRALAAGKDPADIPGVWYRKDGQVVPGGRSDMIPDLDSIPFPARHLLPMEKYLMLSPRGTPDSRNATIITSRGCPFACTFCSIHPVYTRKWRARSAENVLAEVDELIEKWGVTSIEFEDDNLTMDAERAGAIFEGLAKREVNWSCPNGIRVDTLDAELLELMRRSGCFAIHLAIESGDPEMLAAMNKKLNLDKVREVVDACNRLEMPFVAFFIFGHPGETERRFRTTMRFAKRLVDMGMVNCGVHIATPYPGTELLRMCREKGYLIHDDADQRMMFPGDIHIETPDFTGDDIIYRVYRMRIAVGQMPDFSSGVRGLLRWKVRPLISKLGLDRRKYLAGIPDRLLEGFHGTEMWIDGRISYRWSSAEAVIKVKAPKTAKSLTLFAKSNRPHSVKVYLEDICLGEATMDPRWRLHELQIPEGRPVGEVNLRFQSSSIVPAELGPSEDTRTLGFILSWYQFQR